MVRIEVPVIRKDGAFGPLGALWTMPTTLIGHAAARISGCGTPERIGGPATRAWLYRLPPRRFRRFGAIAIGHAIIASRRFWSVMALGFSPMNSPIRASTTGSARPICPYMRCRSSQARSSTQSARAPGFSPWHTYNPLERVFICVPADAVADPPPPGDPHAVRVLRAFGLEESGP